jgi:insecticidal toxin complex protein TccC
MTNIKVDEAKRYQNTPEVKVFDNRGLVIREVQYNRRAANENIESYITTHRYNTLGQLVSSTDPRLFDKKAAPTLQQTFSLSGRLLYSEHSDAGSQLQLSHAQNEEFVLWSRDSRGTERSGDYDQLGRVTVLWEKSRDRTEKQCQERFYYGERIDDLKEAQNANQRGQCIRHQDTAGQRLYSAYAIQQHALSVTQHFLKDTDSSVNWPEAIEKACVLLEAEHYTTTWRYSALSEIIEQTDAKGHQQFSSYNRLGQLKATSFCLSHEEKIQPLLLHADYDAQDKIRYEELANGLEIERVYEKPTLRLLNLKTRRKSETAYLQDLHYSYDPVGNVISIRDHSQATDYHTNQQIDPENHYTYDALYQLIHASGRENKANTTENYALPELSQLSNSDKTQLHSYQRDYQYDKAGNIQQIKHNGANPYTNTFEIEASSNRCSIEKSHSLQKSYDANGNTLYLQTGRTDALQWNLRNELQTFTLLARDKNRENDSEGYCYDASGQRQQKLRRWKAQQQQHIERVRYLPNLELREKWQENLDKTNKKTNETLHCIQLNAGSVSVRVLHWEQGKPKEIENNQQRYSLDNHLGSCQFELDHDAKIISYEEYYPYGGTALWSCRDRTEAAYKYVRYSGKERDCTGLYYYGARYYIPWLGRWLNPDPAGTVDGLNLFCAVKNNPIKFIDSGGFEATSFQSYSNTITWQPENIGNFTLYRSNNNNPKKELMIYAHGGHSYFEQTSAFIPSDMTMNFYTEHGTPLISSNWAPPTETVTKKDKTTNYSLGPVGERSAENLMQFLKLNRSEAEIPDLLIIQEGQMETLKKALKIAKQEGYGGIHGRFCRSTFLPNWLPKFMKKLLAKHINKNQEKRAREKEKANKAKRQEELRQDCLRERREKAALRAQQADTDS